MLTQRYDIKVAIDAFRFYAGYLIQLLFSTSR
ncbi:putative uncharacterized protein [Salmonella enterica subsp. enterica serovar Senftenberg str. SS209]|nr:putative uncharacterized protein [Salmonella enterica subsp. enterica serovar Senftenberg str. SS209]